MSSLLLVGVTFVLFIIAYRFYGRFMEKLWEISSARKTPAMKMQDGVDYVPVKHWTILFGHHFASIAGAGPILGPVIVCVLWGWLPATLWIIFGSTLLGGVHDFASLVLSLRHKGRSIGEITETVMGHRSKIFFSLFLWFSLILVVAVFSSVTANTFVQTPEIVIPSFGLILIALLFGLFVYRLNVHNVYATLGSLVSLVFLFLIGNRFPLALTVSEPIKIWIVILLIYSFVASIIPVNFLLQPRDYLSSFILITGLVVGYVGLATSHPIINAPAYISFTAAGGKGTLWPMMFVIIACGAISGFHSLVASGTTSKQITNERDARKIAYGSMLTEGILAILALLSVCAGLFWNKTGSPLNYPELMKTGDWIGTFATGYGQLTSRLINPDTGKMLAIVMINAFVLTSLDTATRIARYISQELFGDSWKIKIFKNRYFSTFFVVLIAGYLAFGNWQKIWPVFGAANQVVAAIVLFVAGLFLLNLKKQARTTFIPSLIMFLTTITALLYQAQGFYRNKNFLLGNISIILVVLAVFFIAEGARQIRRSRAA